VRENGQQEASYPVIVCTNPLSSSFVSILFSLPWRISCARLFHWFRASAILAKYFVPIVRCVVFRERLDARQVHRAQTKRPFWVEERNREEDAMLSGLEESLSRHWAGNVQFELLLQKRRPVVFERKDREIHINPLQNMTDTQKDVGRNMVHTLAGSTVDALAVDVMSPFFNFSRPWKIDDASDTLARWPVANPKMDKARESSLAPPGYLT
jgi:hypothetical protein